MLIHLVSCGIHWYHRLVPSIGTITVVLPAVVPTVVPIVVLPVLVPCVAFHDVLCSLVHVFSVLIL